MKHKYDLPSEIQEQLLRLPETGMGYQVVEFTLRGGRIVSPVTVLNGSIAESAELFVPAEIETVRPVKQPSR